MRIFSLLLVLLMSVTGVTYANDATVGEKVNTIIETLKKGVLEVNFSVLYVGGANKTTDMQYGKCYIKGEKFHLSMSGIDTYFDGKTQWVYMAADNEVTVSEPTKEEVKELSPLLMLEYYSKNHRISLDMERRANDILYVNMFPMDLESEHFKVTMEISKEDKPLKFTIFQKNGDKIVFTWDSIDESVELQNKDFEFKKSEFPNVYVNDMR